MQTKLKKLQKDFYDILYEICKSEKIGGGATNINLLYEDLCGLKDQLDVICDECDDGGIDG